MLFQILFNPHEEVESISPSLEHVRLRPTECADVMLHDCPTQKGTASAQDSLRML